MIHRNAVLISCLSLFTMVFYLTGCSTKPVNLSVAREEVKEYYESGKFDEELTGVIKEAKEKFAKVEAKANSVVVFDVDETALDNYGLAEETGFGYVYEMNKEWNSEMKAPAIAEVKDLYNYLLDRGFKIIFLTGRNFPEYEVTYKNLKRAGYTQFDTLITQRKDELKLKATDFKSLKRVELTSKGYNIVGTVGDQWSDLDGPDHGIQIKIPNYLYQIK